VEWSRYEKVPYLRKPTVEGDTRGIWLFPLWDGQRWRHWLPQPSGLIEIAPLDLLEGSYLARQSLAEADLCVPFLDFMWKYCSWPDTARWLKAIETDVSRLAASLGKIEHIFNSSDGPQRRDTAIFVSTEVEYVLSRVRSLFDSLQMTVNSVWSRIELTDPAAQQLKKRQKPPTSFAAVAKKVRSRGRDEHPYGLPDALLTWYEGVADFFFATRNVRDKVVHGDDRIGYVYALPGGYGIAKDGLIAQLAPPAAPDHQYNDAVIALLPILANVVCQAIYACNAFVDVVARVLKMPEPLIDGYDVFLRAPHTHSLAEAQAILNGKSPWRSSLASSEVASVR
jgi:hypothetical protein